MSGPMVIVGAGLAGLRAAEALRDEGYDGELTVVGDEKAEPYDRPPLSKQILTGYVPSSHATLPRLNALDGVKWELGVRAAGLDLDGKQVHLDDGRSLDFDKVLIATGVRARPWHVDAEASLDGVFVIHTIDDAHAVREKLAAGPNRVVVIGGGFTGSEVASVCRMLDIDVTLVELGEAPLAGALGGVIGRIAAQLQRDAGVDLRTGVRVESMDGENGRVSGVTLSDGTTIDAELVVVAMGGIRNTDWLVDSGLAAGVIGIGCDAGCRAVDLNAIVTDDVFVAGDVAVFPHPLYGYQRVALEHWKNAVNQARVAAHNMLADQSHRRPHVSIPWFWSIQFETNIKSVGVPTLADEVVVTQGSTGKHHFVAAYGQNGVLVGAVSFNQGRYLEWYERQIAQKGKFPPDLSEVDQATNDKPVPAEFPQPSAITAAAPVILAGNSPAELHIQRTSTEALNR
jgi:3-phenylpropionate/trans-cinnamate dioxygenase ferredoxin reductase component